MEYESLENEQTQSNHEEVFTDSFRAGKRTYFFDVKATKNSELYITITESKRRLQKNGKFLYEKHHIYLFKEDFEKFANSLNTVVDYIKQNQPAAITSESTDEESFENINELLVPVLDFEDLDKQ
jgi:hypothetical protein